MGSLGDMRRKKQLYAHLFALTSVKTVVVGKNSRRCPFFISFSLNLVASSFLHHLLIIPALLRGSAIILLFLLQHWFQIVACDRFQAYDENMSFEKEGYRPFVPQIFPIRQIKCPMSVFYGSDDHLTDIPWLLRELPLGRLVVDCCWQAQQMNVLAFLFVLSLCLVSSSFLSMDVLLCHILSCFFRLQQNLQHRHL